MSIDEMIEVLQDAKRDFGGDTEVVIRNSGHMHYVDAISDYEPDLISINTGWGENEKALRFIAGRQIGMESEVIYED